MVSAELEKMKKMSVKKFAVQMANAWMSQGNPDAHILRGLYLSACDGERAMEFYREVKRRKGLALQDGSRLSEFFTIVGERDAKGFLKQLLDESPQGVPEIESLLHGWAVAEPHEAVEWLNSLPAIVSGKTGVGSP